MPTSIVPWTLVLLISQRMNPWMSAVKILLDGRISIMDFILTILDPSELDFAYNRDWIYNRSRQEKESSTGQGQKGKLEKMFDRLFADSRGRARILDCNKMDMVKEALHGTLDSITPEFLSTWDLNSAMQNVVVPKAPVLHHILRCAAQTDNARAKNKINMLTVPGRSRIGIRKQNVFSLPVPAVTTLSRPFSVARTASS
ncbi:hypothetical protein BDR07DRAFT_1427207 [Suillus spraguei]|nr:hypothetical protein BDR07DRAFT_1427207 [Suillus spraguei]